MERKRAENQSRTITIRRMIRDKIETMTRMQMRTRTRRDDTRTRRNEKKKEKKYE